MTILRSQENVRISRCREHRMRIYPKTKVWLPCPVLQVVARFKAFACEIRDLILLYACSIQKFASLQIELRCRVFVRNEVRVISCSVRDQFAAEPGILIDLVHVEAEVMRRGGA